jgi:hypothetical protein
MLTFKQFVTELAWEDVSLSAAEVAEMTARFGKKVLQMEWAASTMQSTLTGNSCPGPSARTWKSG